MSIRFIHFSDTHLGFSDLDNQNSEGVNIREQDFYNSFSHIIDKIIEEKPDFAVHTGDLFHRSSPSNRTIVFALNEIRRLSDAGIVLYIVAGNHDYPKSIFTTPIYNIFNGLPGVKIIFSESYEVIETAEYIIHALPHINEDTHFLDECLNIKVKDKSKPNFLFMHLSVGRSYLMDEFGERVFPAELMPVLNEFVYVGLGHWHKYQFLQSYGNVYYSGSTDRLSEKEAGDQKGYISVKIDGKSDVLFHPINSRPFEKLEIPDCFVKTKEDIIQELKKFYELKRDALTECILAIHFSDLDSSQLYNVTSKDINEIFPEALHISISRSVKDSGEKLLTSASSFDLKEQLSTEMKKSFLDDKEFSKVQQLTMNLLSQLEEEEANANQ